MKRQGADLVGPALKSVVVENLGELNAEAGIVLIDHDDFAAAVARDAGFHIPEYEEKQENWRQAILNLKVCDPAMGSGSCSSVTASPFLTARSSSGCW